ncbi:DUF721 domain-containing protein [Chromatiaceae bacterium AAb-1]|nr:DUF721 domain-containing protein [Chromatiaceae bacterium AAb-1]
MTRYNRRPEDISQLISRGSLAQTQKHLSIIHKLNAELCLILQLEQLNACQVSNIKDGRAIILCSSPGYANLLKRQRGVILDNFRQKILPDLAGIDIDVSPNGQINQIKAAVAVTQSHQLSENAAELLCKVASNSDGKLKQALLKLAANVGKNT